MNKKTKKRQVIPGFGISMGVTLTMTGLVVLVPLASLILCTSGMGFGEFWKAAVNQRTIPGYQVSLICSFTAACINSIFGLILAWIMVRYDFPFKRFFNGMIELPFAIPTAVAGIALTSLYSGKGVIGRGLETMGIRLAYTKGGIIMAMVFIGIPFVVRSVEPVLKQMDLGYEEAAALLGAGKIRVFLQIIFPELLPSLITGFALAFARALGEYGSVVFIAGNIPYKTEIVPLLIMGKLEQFDYQGATAIALVMLVFSYSILLVINSVQVYTARFTEK